jgi:dephospho-CoA kinase
MTVIGVTGPTGAGKTTVLREIERQGGLVIDCDQIYARLLKESAPLRRDMEACFGPVFGPDGGLDRKRLAGVVFADPQALSALNGITHGYVKDEVAELLAQARQAGVLVAAVEAIALVESGLADWCDAVVGILAPRELRASRIMAREGISEEAAQRRIAAQKPDSFFIHHCPYLLHNEGDREVFLQQIRQLLSQLTAQHTD